MNEASNMQVQGSNCCADSSTCAPVVRQADTRRAVFRPNVDIVRAENEVLIYADLPGVEQGDIEVNFERGVLELRARISPRSGKRTPVREEYALGDFLRSFRLAEEYDGSKTSAEYHAGVLCLRVPKASQAQARRVEIRAGHG